MVKEVSKSLKNKGAQSDVLGDILNTLRFRGSVFFRSELAAPWGMSIGKEDYPRFHIALSGDFFIGSDEQSNESVNIKHMDIVMLPNGDTHWVSDQMGRELISSEYAGDACALGQPLFQEGKITNKLICGQVQYDQELLHPLLDSLPSIMHFSDIEDSDPIWMTVVLIDTVMDEVRTNQPSVIDRLTEALFLQLLNKYVIDNKDVTGFFAALDNPRVHRVLELIHNEPQYPWSLDLLGEHAGMSRATLARQFKNTMGIPPMTYLTNWRMMKAHYLLKYSSMTTEEIADLVGFSTARTLNKAFLRHYNYTLSELRRS